MKICYVLSYQRNWLHAYVPLEPQFVVKQVTIQYVLLLLSALFHPICRNMVPGK
jgi:hypothetical protein